MHSDAVHPPVIAMTMWLNAHRSGSISATDAANACEFISQTLDVHRDGQPVTWVELIEMARNQKSPCIAVLPSQGNPSGIPAALLASVQLSAGALAIGEKLLLFQNRNLVWTLHEQPHTIVQPDHSFSRRMFLEGLERATKTLSSADLIGDRSKVEARLDALLQTHLPPSVDQRLLKFLEQATRVRVVTQVALSESAAQASRSTDNLRIAMLQEIDGLASNLITAIASH